MLHGSHLPPSLLVRWCASQYEPWSDEAAQVAGVAWDIEGAAQHEYDVRRHTPNARVRVTPIHDLTEVVYDTGFAYDEERLEAAMPPDPPEPRRKYWWRHHADV